MAAIRTATCQLDDTIDRLLIVSDIHAHLQPLEAFDALRAAMPGTSQVIFNGDLVYGGPRPVECTQWIMQNAGPLATLGNHDQNMLEGDEGEDVPYTEAGAWRRLTDEQRRYFAGRPHRLELRWRNKRIVLMHGHIAPDGAHGSWRASPDEQVKSFTHPNADLCVTSHTHYAFLRNNPNRIFANTGAMSVPILAVRDEAGLHPQNGCASMDPSDEARPSFLAVTSPEDRLEVYIVHFDFDRQSFLDDLERAGHASVDFYRQWLTDGILPLAP